MLQLSVLLILCSINEVKWVAAAPAADPSRPSSVSPDPQPTPMFTGYDDFQKRYKEYNNTSLYYFISTTDKTACACQESVVICYTQQGENKVHFVQYTDESNGTGTVIIHNEFDCITCLTQPRVLLKERKCNPDLKFPLGNYLSTTVSDYKSTDRRFITSDLAVVQNFSNVTQTCMTTSYAKEVSESRSVSLTYGLKISASATFKVPYVSEVKLGFEIGASTAKTQTRATKTTVTAPPQPVTLPPNRTITVHYSLYTTRLESNGLLNFGIDDETDLDNEITKPRRFRRIEVGVRFKNYDFNLFPNPFRGGLIITEEGKFELRNFPAKQTKDGHELEIDFSHEKSLFGTEDDPGPYDELLMQRPRIRTSFKKSTTQSRH